MKTNAKGIAIIKKWESCRLDAYADHEPEGILWTIGWGHTSRAGAPKVYEGMKITKKQADEILASDLVPIEKGVEKLLTRVPTSNQFSAMVSLAYNIGLHKDGFPKSAVLRYFNQGDIKAAANSFKNWVKDDGKVMNGLVARRADEATLFLETSVAEVPPPPDIEPPEAQQETKTTMPSKTIISAVGAIIASLVGMYTGTITPVEGIGAIWLAIQTIFLRQGMTKEVQKLK